MAYDPNQQDPNKKDQPPEQDQTGNLPPMTSSAPGAGPAAQAPGKGSAPQATPAQPFQNLQAYLSANAPQVNAQAEKIAGDLTNQYGQIQGNINQAQSNFGLQVKGGYTQANPELTNQAATNPGQFVSTPQNVKAFQDLYNDQYTGPLNFESTSPYANVSQAATTAANTAKNFKTIPGLQTYFQGNNPNATLGGNTLDAVLLQGSQGAFQKVQNAAKPFENLGDYLSNAVGSANRGVSEAQQEAQNINQGLHQQFTGEGGVVPTWQQGVQNRTSEAQSKADAYNKSVNDVQQKVAGMSDKLGNTEEAIRLYNEQNYNPANVGVSSTSTLPPITYDLANFSKVPNVLGAATPESVASQGDFANEAALNQLLGLDLSNLNPALANQAGSYNVPKNASLNIQQAIDELTKELGSAKTGFTNNGSLQYQGTPEGSIITNRDLAPGTNVYYNPLGQGKPSLVNPATPPVGYGHVVVPGQGAVLNPVPGGSTSFNPLGPTQYYSNQPLQNAGSSIDDLLTYLQGIK